MAATSAPGVRAVTRNPGGASTTASRWLIHTSETGGKSPRRSEGWSVSIEVFPNSPPPVAATRPPIRSAMSW